MPFVIKTNKGYIKRTSSFGMFHGDIVLTEDVGEALRFTRLVDANRRARVVMYRTSHAGHRDRQKFGQLTAEVVEHS